MEEKDPRSHLVSNNSDEEIKPSDLQGAGNFAPGREGRPPPLDVTEYGAKPSSVDEDVRTPEHGQLEPQAIIGEDDRERVEDLRDWTTNFPAVTTVLIRYDNGNRCSGFMYGFDMVITAGHCVFEGGEWKDTDSMTMIAAYDARESPAAPYGECGATSLHSQNGWVEDEDWNYDFGLVKLDCEVGFYTGWQGVFWTERSLNNSTAKIWQYPADKNDQMWVAEGVVSHGPLSYYTFDHEIDTEGGSSGSAVSHYFSYPSVMECSRHCASGVHSGWREKSGEVINRGTRITPARYNLIIEMSHIVQP